MAETDISLWSFSIIIFLIIYECIYHIILSWFESKKCNKVTVALELHQCFLGHLSRQIWLFFLMAIAGDTIHGLSLSGQWNSFEDRVPIDEIYVNLNFEWVAVISLGIELVNSMWTSDATWQHKSESRLAQIMTCCLTSPNHYLSQCWLIISEVLWHSPLSNFTGNTQDIYIWRLLI